MAERCTSVRREEEDSVSQVEKRMGLKELQLNSPARGKRRIEAEVKERRFLYPLMAPNRFRTRKTKKVLLLRSRFPFLGNEETQTSSFFVQIRCFAYPVVLFPGRRERKKGGRKRFSAKKISD